MTGIPPVARIVPVVDHQFGLDVPDPYRWMEAGDDELASWLRAHGAHAARALAAIAGSDVLRARIRELGLGTTSVFNVQIAGDRLLYYVVAAGEQVAKLAVREGDHDRILVDPLALADGDQHAALHAYSVSPDGARAACVVTRGGGERGELHVIDIATGARLDTIDRIWGEFPASWLPDGNSFFYTQLAVPHAGVDPMAMMVAKLHVIGQPVEHDIALVGNGVPGRLGVPPDQFPWLWVPVGTAWVIAGLLCARTEQRIAIAPLGELDRSGAGKTPWREVAAYSDAIEEVTIRGDRLYLKTYKDAPNRRIVSVPLDQPDLADARVEIPEDPDAAIVDLASARDALYVSYARDGCARLVRWPWAGAPAPITLPGASWISQLATHPLREGLVFQLETWLTPATYHAVDAATSRVSPLPLASKTTADFSSITATEVEVDAEDGARVPLTILHRLGLTLDGTHPTILYGYGAYGSIERPAFSPTLLAWLERDGVFAVAHGRGGGEKGRAWQEAGARANKMTGVQDFIACAEHLVAHRFTSSARLAAVGWSMGGMLVGRAITARPDLFAAANLAAGILNPLRILAAENGANQKAELGDPTDPDAYRWILGADPYQHVERDAAYPAIVLTVGLKDHRVAPWMSAKMAARLMNATASGKPILVRVVEDAGHGIGSTRDQMLDERADVWSFFLDAFAR